MTVVLDTGALIAIERGRRDLVAILKRERLAGRVPLTTGGVVAQYWRGGQGRQSEVARLLQSVETRPIDDELGQKIGLLLGRNRSTDVVDASVVLVSRDGDEIYTSDTEDFRALAEVADRQVDLIAP